MAKTKMTVYKALESIKIYEDRLTKTTSKLDSFVFVDGVTKSSHSAEDIDKMSKHFTSNFDTIVGLINNVRLLKSAVYKSNLKTKIKIPGWNNGKEGTVAEAISDYKMLPVYMRFYKSLQNNINETEKKIRDVNERLTYENIFPVISQMNLADNKKSTTTDVANTMKSLYDDYVDKNRMFAVDPNTLMDRAFINKKIEEYNEHLINFHDRIVQKNSETIIEVDFDEKAML